MHVCDMIYPQLAMDLAEYYIHQNSRPHLVMAETLVKTCVSHGGSAEGYRLLGELCYKLDKLDESKDAYRQVITSCI